MNNRQMLEIFVWTLSGRIIALDIESTDTIEIIMTKLQEMEHRLSSKPDHDRIRRTRSLKELYRRDEIELACAKSMLKMQKPLIKK